MNYLIEIKKIIDEYTNTKPGKGFEITYLQNCERLLQLHAEAIGLGENIDNEEDYQCKVKAIYEMAKQIVD